MDVFIDEAGDLGFSDGSSRFFIVSYLVPDNPWNIRHSLKRLHKTVNKNRKTKINELHFTDAEEQCRLDCFQRVSSLKWYAGLIVLDKNTVKPHLQGKPELYNYSVLHFMLWSVLQNYNPVYNLFITIDRGMNRERRNHFDKYGAEKANFIWSKMKRSEDITQKVKIRHENSQNDYCLQMADFLASATFQLYEKGNHQYFSHYKKKLNRINYLFR